MEMTRQERIELHDKLVALLDGVRRELKSRFPEVISVDLGLKERAGQLTQEFSWRVFVQEKMSEHQLHPEALIPKEIAGVPTDVQVVNNYSIQADDSSYSLLLGGIQISGSGLVGTLGCFVTLGADTKVHILSNHHVLMGPSGSAGDLVGQPNAACDLCCCKCCEVAVVVNGVVGTAGGATNTVDAAVAVIVGQSPSDSKKVPFSNRIVDIGPIFGSGTAMIGDAVKKRGRTTGLTTGIVSSTTADAITQLNPGQSPAVMATYTGQIDISVSPEYPQWSAGGDSGSAVVNGLGQVVGLHFAGRVGGGAANHIATVSTRLGGITVLTSGTAETLPHTAYAISEPIIAANPLSFLSKIEQKLNQTPCGQQFLHTIHENRREVLDLINDNREVKVAWNRFQGPAYVGHFAKNANEPHHPIPREVNGYSLQHLLIKMNEVLERNGSRKLAKAVEDYSQTAFQFAAEYTGIDAIDTMLAQGDFCPKCGTLKNGKHYA